MPKTVTIKLDQKRIDNALARLEAQARKDANGDEVDTDDEGGDKKLTKAEAKRRKDARAAQAEAAVVAEVEMVAWQQGFDAWLSDFREQQNAERRAAIAAYEADNPRPGTTE